MNQGELGYPLLIWIKFGSYSKFNSNIFFQDNVVMKDKESGSKEENKRLADCESFDNIENKVVS